MNRRQPFLKPGKPRDPLAGLTDEMRDALEAGARSMLAFADDGGVRAQNHFDRVVCSSACMRALIGLQLFAPIGDDGCVRLTRKGDQLSRLSAYRRAQFANYRARQAANRVEGRAFVDRMAARRAELARAAQEKGNLHDR